MSDGATSKRTVVDWFTRCTSCSETMFTVLNRAAGLELLVPEQAAHPLSGGVLMRGRACGLLWGSALAAGARAKERLEPAQAANAALAAAVVLAREFPARFGSALCSELTGKSLETTSGRLGYAFSVEPGNCVKRAIEWAPLADGIMDRELRHPAEVKENCACKIVAGLRETAGEPGEGLETLASPLAGGLGLSGDVCAAVTVPVLVFGLRFYEEATKRDSRSKGIARELGLARSHGSAAKSLAWRIEEEFGSISCRKIGGARFADASEHGHYVAVGGCDEVIERSVELLAAQLSKKS